MEYIDPNFILKKEYFNIGQLSGQIHNDLREGYTGGSVEVYLPETSSDTLAYNYDYNSL